MICRTRREELGLTCSQLEERLGFKATRINKWENGYVYPRGKTLAVYSKFLGLTADTVLLAITEQMEKHKSEKKKGHRMSGTRIYRTWTNLRQRCSNSNRPDYKYYGGKGARVCDEWNDWKNGFLCFYDWAMANGYKDGLTIDRVDSSKGYCPSNCEWITHDENRRKAHYDKWNRQISALREKHLSEDNKKAATSDQERMTASA